MTLDTLGDTGFMDQPWRPGERRFLGLPPRRAAAAAASIIVVAAASAGALVAWLGAGNVFAVLAAGAVAGFFGRLGFYLLIPPGWVGSGLGDAQRLPPVDRTDRRPPRERDW
jgi:hypothetical protein